MTFDLRPASSAKVNGQPPRSATHEGAPATGPTEPSPRAVAPHAADAFSGAGRNVLRDAAESLEADLSQALAELEALKRQVFPPAAKVDPAKQTLSAVRANLGDLVGIYRDRERDLLARLETADSPALAQMIQVQLVQLGRTKAQFEAMQGQLNGFAIPEGLNPRARARLSESLNDLQGVVQRLAGADSSQLPALRVEFERAMTQIRTPERDLTRDSLTNDQFALLLDASRLLASLHSRLHQLSYEAHGRTERKMPADSQMHQLTQRYHDYARLFDALVDFQPRKGLSPRQRQELAMALRTLRRELPQILLPQAAFPEGLLQGLRRWQAH